MNPAERGRNLSVQESDHLAITSTKSTAGSSGCTLTFGAKNLAILHLTLVVVPRMACRPWGVAAAATAATPSITPVATNFWLVVN